jgi:hypothetical protein
VSNPIDDWLEGVRSELYARRLEAADPIQRLSAAVARYEQACAAELVKRFADEHRLRAPVGKVGSPLEAAQALLKCVEALPELQSIQRLKNEAGATALAPSEAAPPLRAGLGATDDARASDKAPAPLSNGELESLPRLLVAVRKGPIVIVGGLNRHEKLSLPAAIKLQLEWVETTRQGTHAIGNLATRIRQHRLAGLILLEGVLGHKHSDPLVAAARDAGIPTAYAGKGSPIALRRAMLQLERMLPPLTSGVAHAR